MGLNTRKVRPDIGGYPLAGSDRPERPTPTHATPSAGDGAADRRSGTVWGIGEMPRPEVHAGPGRRGPRGLGRSWGSRLASSGTALLLAGCLGGWGGCGQTAVESPDPATAPAEAVEAAGPRPARLVGDADADAPPILPALTDDALAARVEAQRRYLGERSLFEDLEGKPMPVLDTDLEGEDDEFSMGFDDELLDALPGSSGIGDAAPGVGGSAANGNALGLYVPIEQPPESALAHFHKALEQLAAGKREKVRIAVYGGSHTQADVYPGYMRTYLQQRFGDGGHGHVSMVRFNGWYKQADFIVENSRHWKIEHAQRREAREDGFFGLLGVSASSSDRKATAKVAPRDRENPDSMADRFEVQYVAQPQGGRFTVYADGVKVETVDTNADDYGPGRYRFSLPMGHHEIEVRHGGHGEVRLLGLVIEKSTPGVVVDTLGISGTRAANHLEWDESMWANYIQDRPPDLWTLFYGTNEANDTHQAMADYVENLRLVIARFQMAAPEASCVLLGPGDFPKQSGDSWIPRPRVAQIVEAQRKIAYEMGCGFWDGVAFMGGTGSMHTWATSRPQMASSDHIHFTRRGYVRIGMAFMDALMADYDAKH